VQKDVCVRGFASVRHKHWVIATKSAAGLVTMILTALKNSQKLAISAQVLLNFGIKDSWGE